MIYIVIPMKEKPVSIFSWFINHLFPYVALDKTQGENGNGENEK